MSLITPQLGLLEDDIVYRLSLMAVNILQPLRQKYPNIVVRSGFRQVNTGVGQHESGEAVDLQINNQTPMLLYEVAKWMEANLHFDQLILNFTNIGDRQPWIHVSFSPQSLRGQVLTKDFADEFHDGLFLVEALTGEEAAAARRAQAALDKLIFAEMVKIQNRANRGVSETSVQDEVTGIVTTSTGSRDANTGGGSGGGDNNADRAALVLCVQDALSIPVGDAETNLRAAFEITKRVAWLLRGEGCGLLLGPSDGESVLEWNGYTFRSARVCYPDGQIYRVLTGDNFQQSGWVDEGVVDHALYVPAIDPGTDMNLEWMACSVPAAGASGDDSGTVTQAV